MVECGSIIGSLAHVEGVIAVLGLSVDPQASNSVDVSTKAFSGAANSTPVNTLISNQIVADIHGFVIIACTIISTLILIDHAIDLAFFFSSNSISLGPHTNKGEAFQRSSGYNELKEKVRPVPIDSVDARKSGNPAIAEDK
jgi:hypothetical protein